MTKSKITSESKIRNEVEGQSTYKYYCPECGHEWYDTYGSSSQCPKCGAWGVLQ